MNDSEKAQTNFLKNIYDTTPEREAAEEEYIKNEKSRITQHEKSIIEYAEEKLFNKDRSYTTLEILFDFPYEAGQSYSEERKIKIHLYSDVWKRYESGVSLFAHEILHSLRPHEIYTGRITFMEEGAARWLENNYLQEKMNVSPTHKYIENPVTPIQILRNKYFNAGRLVTKALEIKPNFFKVLLNGNDKKMSDIVPSDFNGFGFDDKMIAALLHEFDKPILDQKLSNYINSLHAKDVSFKTKILNLFKRLF